jgi:hypothetical protein
MKKNFSNIIAFLFGLIYLTGSAFAQLPMRTTDGSYLIPAFTVSGGGRISMETADGSYRAIDLKGQGVIGRAATTGFSVGLGGIYGEVGAGGAGVAGAEDNGLIYNTRISRLPDATIRLDWNYRSGVTKADIWRRSGEGSQFLTDTTSWSRVALAIADTFFLDDLRAGNGQNGYYRVVPSGTIQANIFGNDSITGLPNNNRTVGKIDLALSANALRLVSFPLYAGSMGAVLSGQLASGRLVVYPQSGGGLGRSEYVGAAGGGSFSGGAAIRPAVGFWFENDATPKTISFVGSFETVGSKSLANLDLSGNPVPYTLNSSLLGGQSGDIMYLQSGGGLGRFQRSGSAWSSFSLGLAQGFWYEKTGTRNWSINLYNVTENRITGP